MSQKKFEKLDLLLEKKIGLKKGDNFEITFRQIGIDSLQIIALVSTIEEELDIQFSIDDLDQIDSIKNLYDCICTKLLES